MAKRTMNDAFIPNHGRDAILEGCDAALLRAAFLQLEEEEIMKYRTDRDPAQRPNAKQAEFARGLQRRTRRRAACRAAARVLPRAARAAACLIAVLAVGMGVALAASPAARSWAVRVLHADIYAETNSSGASKAPTQYFGDEPLSGFRGGDALGGALYLAGGINSDDVIYVQSPESAQPVRYERHTPDGWELVDLTALNDGMYALCAAQRAENRFALSPGSDREYGIGRVRFSEDSYAVEALTALDREALFGGDGRAPASAAITGMCAGDGFIYLLSACNYASEDEWFGTEEHRLLRFDPATGALEALDLPEEGDCDLSMFGGRDGHAYLAFSLHSAEAVRILRIEPDGGFSTLTEIPCAGGAQPCAFAIDASGGALYYLQERCVYRAPVADPSGAQPIATTGQTSGEAVLVGDGTLVIINEMSAQFYDLAEAPAALTQLRVDGHGSNESVETAFAEAHPGVNLTGDPKLNSIAREKGYVDAILAGESAANVWMLEMEEVPCLLDAGLYSEIDDPALLQAVSEMVPGLQRAVTRNGKLAAVPVFGCAYADVAFDPRVMEQMGLSEGALPETWAELLTLLREHSRGAQPQSFCLNDYADMEDCDFSQMLLTRMCGAYLRLCQHAGQAADFSDHRFMELLNLWKEIDFGAFRYARLDMPDNTVEGTLIDFDQAYNLPGFAVPRTLRFGEGDPRVSESSGIVAVVNPESPNQELACAYIRAYYEAPARPEDSICFNASGDARVLAGDFNSAEDIERMREQIGDLTIVPSVARKHPNFWEEVRAAARAFGEGGISAEELASALNEGLA